MLPSLIDSHSHLQFSAFDKDRQEVIGRMREKNISTIIIGGNLEESQEAIALAEKNDFFVSIGLHPIHVEEINDNSQGIVPAEDFDVDKFSQLLKNPRVVGIGECGLDYFHVQDESKKKEQKEIFQKQIQLAKDFKKPLILHIRDKNSFAAYQDVLDILEKNNYQGEGAGVVHFFSADWAMAKKFLDLGFYLSFTGVITFTHQYDEVIKNTPIEKLLVETDSPYVAPEPFRGKRNEPIFVEYVAKRLAELKDISLEEVVEITTKNCTELFGLDYTKVQSKYYEV
jgi:TatD DNase family protein